MTEPMKTLEQLQQDWGNSTCSKEPEQYIYDYMKNQVLAEREKIKKDLGKSIIEHEYELDFPGDPVINVSVLFKLIDSL